MVRPTKTLQTIGVVQRPGYAMQMNLMKKPSKRRGARTPLDIVSQSKVEDPIRYMARVGHVIEEEGNQNLKRRARLAQDKAQSLHETGRVLLMQ